MDGINDQNNNGAVHNQQKEVQSNVERHRINCPGQEEGEEEEGVTYMECRRNVSLAAGRYTVYGCSEFLRAAVGDQNSMLCAACGCHRNFHRKVLLAHLMDPASYLFLINNAHPVRPMPQPQPQPQLQPPPLPLLPPEVPPEIVDAESEIEEEEEEEEENDEDEEEEEDYEDEDEDEEDDYEEEESEEERSELDSESDEKIESAYREEKDSMYSVNRIHVSVNRNKKKTKNFVHATSIAY